jgi:hypothetical protein
MIAHGRAVAAKILPAHQAVPALAAGHHNIHDDPVTDFQGTVPRGPAFYDPSTEFMAKHSGGRNFFISVPVSPQIGTADTARLYFQQDFTFLQPWIGHILYHQLFFSLVNGRFHFFLFCYFIKMGEYPMV